MKKVFPMFLALGLIFGMWSSQALAYTQTYLDKTLIQASGNGSGYIGGQWYDIIGGNEYELYQIDVTWTGNNVTLDIYTNTSGGRIGSDYVADIALDLDQNGVWETGIVLKNDGRTGFYNNYTMYTFGNSNNTHWQISDDFSSIPGTYGTKYDRSNNPNPAGGHVPFDPPVRLKTSVLTSGSLAITGNWDSVPGGSPTNYLLTLTLAGVNTTGDWKAFDVLWGTQTCANDTQYTQAAVPIPASLFLLGSGILGLGLVGWRGKKAEKL